MSHSSLPPLNPYATPLQAYAPLPETTLKMPTFCVVMFIISLILAVLRIPVVFYATMNWIRIPPEFMGNPIFLTAPFEILSGAAIVLFGIAGNIGMLRQRRWGVVLGFLTLISSLFSLAVALWQLFIVSRTLNAEQQATFLVGALVTLVIRGTLIGLFALAVFKMRHYLRLKAAQPA